MCVCLFVGFIEYMTRTRSRQKYASPERRILDLIAADFEHYCNESHTFCSSENNDPRKKSKHTIMLHVKRLCFSFRWFDTLMRFFHVIQIFEVLHQSIMVNDCLCFHWNIFFFVIFSTTITNQLFVILSDKVLVWRHIKSAQNFHNQFYLKTFRTKIKSNSIKLIVFHIWYCFGNTQ